MYFEAIHQDEAAQALRAADGLDPENRMDGAAAARAGQCLRLTTATGQIVLSIGQEGDALWCYGAAGTGSGMTAAGLQGLEILARQAGLESVQFQTMRRGLVKQARARGYQVARTVGRGYVMEKEI